MCLDTKLTHFPFCESNISNDQQFNFVTLILIFHTQREITIFFSIANWKCVMRKLSVWLDNWMPLTLSSAIVETIQFLIYVIKRFTLNMNSYKWILYQLSIRTVRSKVIKTPKRMKILKLIYKQRMNSTIHNSNSNENKNIAYSIIMWVFVAISSTQLY